jgi:predicted nucleic acid-binding protein/Arc/MetJ family transcription regulator
MASVGA